MHRGIAVDPGPDSLGRVTLSRCYNRGPDCVELFLHFRYCGNGRKAATQDVLGTFSDRIDAEFLHWIIAVLDGEGHRAVNHKIDRIAQIRGNTGGSLAALFHLNSGDGQTAHTFSRSSSASRVLVKTLRVVLWRTGSFGSGSMKSINL